MMNGFGHFVKNEIKKRMKSGFYFALSSISTAGAAGGLIATHVLIHMAVSTKKLYLTSYQKRTVCLCNLAQDLFGKETINPDESVASDLKTYEYECNLLNLSSIDRKEMKAMFRKWDVLVME